MAKSTQANFDAIDKADAHAQGIDGGLNLKTDNTRLAPPATTRSDNAWYTSPGNASQLPAAASVMQPNTVHVYNVHSRDVQQPASNGDLMVHGEVLDAPSSAINGFTTPCWSDGNGATINTQQPCLPATLRTRVMTGRLSVAGKGTTDISNLVMAKQDSGYSSVAPQRYALGYYDGTTFRATFGLCDGQVETPETVTLALTADYLEIGGVAGTNTWILAAISGATITYYTYDFKGVSQGSAVTVSSAALAYNSNANGQYAPMSIFQHAGRTFIGYITNPSGAACALMLWDVATKANVSTGVSNSSAPGYGFALATPYRSAPSAGTFFFAALFNGQVYVVAQASPTAAGTVVATSSALGVASSTGYTSGATNPGQVNFQATMHCSIFDAQGGVNAGASLGVVVFRHYPQVVTTAMPTQSWYQSLSVDRLSFQANATVATNAGTIASLGQNIFATPSGVQLCSKAFDFKQALVAAKSAYVLVRCGGVEGQANFTGNPGSASSTQNWWTYGQPTYFVVDHQARIVSRMFEGRGPVDAGYGLTNNTIFASQGGVNARGAANQVRSLSAPISVALGGDSSALDTTLPAWVQTFSTANLQSSGYLAVPNNIIMQPAAVTLSLSAQGVSCPPLQAGPYTVLSGALTCVHDGRSVVEANYHFRAHNPIVSVTTSTSSGCGTAGTYYYAVVYEWYDSLGRLHRSEPSTLSSAIVSSGSYLSSATIYVPLPVSAKSIAGGVLYARLYRSTTNNTSGILYLVGTTAISALTSSSFYAALTDDGTLNDTGNLSSTSGLLATQPRLYTNTVNSFQTFASQPPPAFIYQCNAKGRAFGVAQTLQNFKLFYSSTASDNFPYEWNSQCYANIPPDLGDIRSIEAIDDKIVVLGTRSLGFLNGDGPSFGYPAAGNNTSVPTPGDGFSLVSPLPTPVGALGSGAPARTPDGLMFQGYSGIQLVGRDLSITPVGAAVDPLTGRQVGNPGLVLGRAATLATLQSVVWANAQGPALVYNYLTQRWSTWPLLPNAVAFTQRLDGSVVSALQPVTAGQFARVASASSLGADVVSLGATWAPLYQGNASAPGLVVETPWILPSGESAGEAQIWDVSVTGQWQGPHILQVEQAYNYNDVYVAQTQFNIAIAPTFYQYRVRPRATSRIWAVRYRVTLLPVTTLAANYAMASLGDLVVNYGSKQGTSRLGAVASG